MGPVAVADLGPTLPHEHLVFGMTGWHLDTVPGLDRDEQVAACERHVRAAYEAGVRTMVEVSTAEMGRDVDIMREVAARTGMNIVCATGLYARRPSAYFVRRSAEEMAELFLHELRHGIGGTGVKAGLVKCAVETGELTEHEQAVLEAAALAHKDSGAPIMVHVEPGGGLPVARFLTDRGVAGSKLVIAHAESSDRFADILEIAESLGVNVGFDRFGYEVTVRNDVRTALVVALCHLGLANRIHLSHDFVCVLHGRDRDRWAGMEDLIQNWGFTYLFERVLPRFGELGISELEIEQMTVTNPKDFLA